MGITNQRLHSINTTSVLTGSVAGVTEIFLAYCWIELVGYVILAYFLRIIAWQPTWNVPVVQELSKNKVSMWLL